MKLLAKHEWEYMQEQGPRIIANWDSPGLDFTLYASVRVVNAQTEKRRKFLCAPDIHREKHGGEKQYYAWRKWPDYKDGKIGEPATLYIM